MLPKRSLSDSKTRPSDSYLEVVASVICSPDPGPKGMLDFYIRIGIRERAEDEEELFHGGSGRRALRQAESETPVAEIIHNQGIS